MNKKILLIRPANVYNYNNYPPLNLILLASALEKEGFQPKIVNSALEQNIMENIRKDLDEVLFVGISMLTSEVPDALKIIHFVRENSDVPVVVGGWHCTLFPEQMADSSLVDYVIAGEGEAHITELAKKLSAGEKPENKLFRKQNYDLNLLPVPDYSLEKNIERFISGDLTDAFSCHVKQPLRWLPYESSRGCPSKCTFCINVVTGNTQYRKKDAGKVILEVEHLVKKYDLTHVKFIDDNFFVDINRVREICQGIIDRNLNITWDAECRCDYFNDRILNDQTLELAKKSGLIQLTLGIESGSQHTLDLMKKGITPAQAENAVEKCNKIGIIARSSFILEIPAETKEDISATIQFINKLRKYPFFSCGVGTFRPYPKCELTIQLIKEGYLSEPSSFEEWAEQSVIDMYTAAEYVRPWQVDGKKSVDTAYYLNIESSSRLGNHQIEKLSDRWINSLFIAIATFRNRMMFYRFRLDINLYKGFLVGYYRRKGNTDKRICYPLPASEDSSDS